MLRRKLLLRIGLLVGGFVIGAIIAVVLLQRVVTEVDRVSDEAELLAGGILEINTSLAAIEASWLPTPSPARDAANRDQGVRRLQDTVQQLGASALAADPASRTPAALEDVIRKVEALAAANAAATTGAGREEALLASLAVREAVLTFHRATGKRLAEERRHLAHSFRALVFGLTVAALVMVNVSVIVLLRMAQMILRPVDELVAATRDLTSDKFDRRIAISTDDEFSELASAYNKLGEHLNASEQRRMETLRQVAIAINHDLNNAISVIELQLRLVGRGALGDPVLHERLGRIQESLARAASVVRGLTQVRRIVLTEYMPGQLMLDLPRSIAVSDAEAVEESPGAPEGGGSEPPRPDPGHPIQSRPAPKWQERTS